MVGWLVVGWFCGFRARHGPWDLPASKAGIRGLRGYRPCCERDTSTERASVSKFVRPASIACELRASGPTGGGPGNPRACEFTAVGRLEHAPVGGSADDGRLALRRGRRDLLRADSGGVTASSEPRRRAPGRRAPRARTSTRARWRGPTRRRPRGRWRRHPRRISPQSSGRSARQASLSPPTATASATSSIRPARASAGAAARRPPPRSGQIARLRRAPAPSTARRAPAAARWATMQPIEWPASADPLDPDAVGERDQVGRPALDRVRAGRLLAASPEPRWS